MEASIQIFYCFLKKIKKWGISRKGALRQGNFVGNEGESTYHADMRSVWLECSLDSRKTIKLGEKQM